MEIKVDPLYCRVVPKADMHLIKKCLEYDSVSWRQGAYCKEKKVRAKYVCNFGRGVFLTGLLPRVVEYCNSNNIPKVIVGGLKAIKHDKVSLPGIVLREDQKVLVDAINNAKRGLIVAPPGIGKTVLAGAVISQYPRSVAVMVVHTRALFAQTIKEFQSWFGSDSVGIVGDNKFNIGRVNVVMAQTAHSLLQDRTLESMHNADVLIIDEAHHCGNIVGHYSMIFENCKAPIRIGFTATPNKEREHMLVCEGYLGQVIGEITMEEGIEKGLLAKPKVKLIPVPLSAAIGEHTTYRKLYEYGVIMNRTRNRLIAKEAAIQVQDGKSVLIMILDVKNGQGEMIQEMAKSLYGLDAEFIQGATESYTREHIKSSLQLKKTKCVIATTIWREGINIPSLDCIINACGGKSEITTLQAIGRGLRRTQDGKDQILIIDFLDPYKYLSQHTIMRLQTYVETGCM